MPTSLSPRALVLDTRPVCLLTCLVAQAILKLGITILPQLPVQWNYKGALSHLVSIHKLLFFFETRSHIPQACLSLTENNTVLLAPPIQHWHYRCMLSCMLYTMFRIKPTVSVMIRNPSTNWATSPAPQNSRCVIYPQPTCLASFPSDPSHKPSYHFPEILFYN